ncbi:unnamed protein product, partial [Onchocerca flexuosa]|uniref:Doublecortin domain-containing protein n=1 Tax=Onchocerca flexuosa TaxID=387005 RepID=A0A183HD63_9BILA
FQDFRLSLPLITSSSKIHNSSSSFTKPTPPDDVKRKNPRVYSYSPISRTRLTVPKRQFSPEPVRKTAKILIGPRRVTETVHLSDLTKILCKLKAGEFSLPSGFTLKYRKRFADEPKSETMSLNLQDDRDSNDSVQLSFENNVENESKNETSAIFDTAVNAEYAVISEQKEETEISNLPSESKHRRGRKRLNINPTAEKILPANSIVETPIHHTVREESPTPLNIPISKTVKGKPRKRTALIKLKRGKPRKNFIFHATANENTPNSDSSGNVPSSSTLSPSKTSVKDSNRKLASSASKSTVFVTNVPHSLSHGENYGSETDEHEDSKIEVLDSGMSVIFSNKDRAQTGNARKVDDIFDAVKDD